jgi:ParB family transcriptional regulator, chromosome partitioning protein
MDLRHLPLDQIDDEALPRDRISLDPDALNRLAAAILAEGQRQPVEVCAISGPRPWGLIAGYRRMAAIRALDAQYPGGAFATVAAFVRAPDSIARALALMVSENETRAPVSPWEKAKLILATVERGIFATPDAAVEGLWPHASRQARSRLRGWVGVVEALGGALTEPQSHSARRMDSLAAACRGGLVDLMLAVLADHPEAGPDSQWHAMSPVLLEAALAATADDDGPVLPVVRRGRARPHVRRVLSLSNGVTLRREWTPTGWVLRVNGRNAQHHAIVDDILDHVEKWFGRAGP